MTEDLTLNMNAYLPLRDVVFNTLREAILKGELKPGERLMELQLAAKLGVSRTPIREGMQMLARDGWLQMETYKGTVVREFDPHYMWELTRVRSALELSAIEDAVKNVTEKDLKCLEEIQEKQKEVLEHYDITRFIQLDREFHTYIYQMSQNRELLKLLSNYYDMFRFMGMQAVRGTDKRRQTTIDEHQGILDALKQKNVEAAVRAMKIHMEETEKNINQNHAMKQNVR